MKKMLNIINIEMQTETITGPLFTYQMGRHEGYIIPRVD